MLADGLQLLDGSEISRTLVDPGRQGTAFPPSPSNGDQFELTQASGQFAPGIYIFDGSKWAIKYPGNSLLPYDISGSTIGGIANGATIAVFLAPRGFSIRSGFEYCVAQCKIAPATDVTFNIMKLSASGQTSMLGQIYFATSETIGIFIQQGSGAINILAGDTISVVAPNPVDQFISDVAFTLTGSLN